MRKVKRLILSAIIVTVLLWPAQGFAWMGECGYEGGISSKQNSYNTRRGVTYEYQEVCFITGEPVVFSGTLTVEKSMKNDRIISRYNYQLENSEKSATLTRSLEFVTVLEQNENGQTIEETSFNRAPSETIEIGDVVYTLDKYEFTRSDLIDPKPAIKYYAGTTNGMKVYSIDDGTGTVTVKSMGTFYGYDQYWGTAEVQVINYMIESERRVGDKIDRWGGTANVSLSSSTVKQLKYVRNMPDQISFEGSYVESEYNSSVLEYTCKLPEFDKNGISTDRTVTKRNSLKTESFPVQRWLRAPDLRHLRGHWAENDIRLLYSLNIFKGNESTFNPEQYITRAEFASAVVQAAKEVPEDPLLTSRTRTGTQTRRTSRTKVVSPFKDVSTDSVYFADIEAAYKRGLVTGREGEMFYPNGNITVAEAVAILIRALGLESLSPGPHAVTSFRDNDNIPAYAREAVYVAEKIGLIQGDDRGYLRPNESITKARAAALINRFLGYMRDGIRKDYRERIINYN